MKEQVVLVNERDEEMGLADKMEAHEKGLLHRAFSVVLFQKNNHDLTLLQQRAVTKYHCPLMWANACCSHPRAGETPLAAAHRRVKEELGIDAPALFPAGSFVYRAKVGDLVEHEFDHVFFGFIEDADLPLVAEEVAAVEWVSADDPCSDPSRQYAPWMKQAIDLARAASRSGAVA